MRFVIIVSNAARRRLFLDAFGQIVGVGRKPHPVCTSRDHWLKVSSQASLFGVCHGLVYAPLDTAVFRFRSVDVCRGRAFQSNSLADIITKINLSVSFAVGLAITTVRDIAEAVGFGSPAHTTLVSRVMVRQPRSVD